MNPIFTNFTKTADSVNANYSKRTGIITTAIAVAVSNCADMPTSEVDNASNHYNMQILPHVRNLLGCFNENMVFDLKTCLDQVRAFWMLRYTASHPLSRPVYSLNFGFFDSMMGVGTFISPDLHAFANENKDQILYLSVAASEVLCTLKENKNDY